MSTDYHDDLRWFTERMGRKLALPKNAAKSSYSEESVDWLLHRLREELDELAVALSSNRTTADDVVDEAADVANFAMFVAARYHNIPRKVQELHTGITGDPWACPSCGHTRAPHDEELRCLEPGCRCRFREVYDRYRGGGDGGDTQATQILREVCDRAAQAGRSVDSGRYDNAAYRQGAIDALVQLAQWIRESRG